jgi:acetaldehyde dehydrogenase
MNPIKVAIIGSGNIGTDLMMKIQKTSSRLDCAALVGIDPESQGLAIARDLGIETTHEGVAGLARMSVFNDIRIVFDATSAGAHAHHDRVLRECGKQIIDLTPAAIGPYVIPVVNLDAHLDAPNINNVTCGGQATIPMVYAVSRVAKVHYAEIVASVSSRSAGPGTRANIDEFTQTTADAIEVLGGAAQGKAIIVLNPADPPILMRNTIFTLSESVDTAVITESVEKMIEELQTYVPGYRLKQEIQYEPIDEPVPLPKGGMASGLKTSIFIEVEGAGHYLPPYAGNLDVMTSAALKTAERLVELNAKGVSA